MTLSVHNRLLRVNLTARSHVVEMPGIAYFRKYLGGWNVILDILLREVPQGIDPLNEQNKLILAPGVLTGLAATGCDRLAVGAKSPLTGGFGAAEVGGHWPTELKKAGLDGLVIEGKSTKPVYIWIKEDQVEIREASHLWGMNTKETQEAIRKELGDDRIRVASIGPGGENRVSFANIMFGLYDAAGRTGLGAVMGSKNLKAIAVRGTSRLEAKNKEGLQQIARDFVERGKKAEWIKMGTGSRSMDYLTSTGNLPVNNFRDGEFPEAMQLDGETILKEMGQGMDACFACSLRCKKRVAAEAPYVIDPDYGGPEYETIASLGSCVGVSDAAVMCKANEICNAYSLDTISTGLAISFAMECFEEGLLTLKDTQGIELKFGNGDALLSMIDKIAHRDGLGSLLAEGPARAARQIGVDASRFAIHVKNQGFPAHEPRLKRALTFGYAVSPTGADHIQAMQGQAMSVADTEGLPADPLLRGLGLLEPLTSEGIEYEKIRASVFYSMIIGALNCLVYCHLAQIAVEMSAQDMVDLVKAGTGWDVSSFEIMKAGERAYTLARVYNMREGLTAADDRLPDRMYAPTTNGPLANVHIDRQEVQIAIHAYYAMMGWDPETGIPTQAKLHELGVGWAITHLPS